MLEINVYNQANLHKLKWENYYLGKQLQLFFVPIILDGSNNYVQNLHGEVGLLAFENYLLPFTIGKYKRKKTTYVASNISQYVDYAEDEIVSNPKYGKSAQLFAPIIFSLLRVFCQITRFDNCIFLNTFLISTNLLQGEMPKSFEGALKKLKKNYPNKSVVFKGMSSQNSLHTINQLKSIGFKSVSGRLLYFLEKNDETYLKKRPYQQDLKNWEKSKDFVWKKIEKLTQEQQQIILSFYNDLYLKKYSNFNPQYTARFIKSAHKSGILPFDLLFKNDELIAAQAIHTNNFELTTPFIGYDQTKPKNWNLYKYMNLRMTALSKEKKLDFNMSSGAGKFKNQRGGKPVFEYNWVYLKGLSFYRKWPFAFFSWIGEKYVKPAMLNLDN
jgi:hypothetical protein